MRAVLMLLSCHSWLCECCH